MSYFIKALPVYRIPLSVDVYIMMIQINVYTSENVVVGIIIYFCQGMRISLFEIDSQSYGHKREETRQTPPNPIKFRLIYACQ